MPEVKASKLLRRVDELRRNVDRFGWSPDQDDIYLKEFVGDLGYVSRFIFIFDEVRSDMLANLITQ